MSSALNNLGIVVHSKVDNDGTCTTIAFPPIVEDKTIEESIRSAVFRSMNFTHKVCNTCELTNKIYDGDQLKMSRLKSAEYIKSHHCAGNIIYHPENAKHLDVANMYFECQQKMIQSHSLQGKTVLFERTNGEIQKGTIVEDCCLLYMKLYDDFGLHITFMVDDEPKYKWITINDRFSNSMNKTVKGLYLLNQDIFNDEIKLVIKECPEWLATEREFWIKFIQDKLDKNKIKFTF